MKRLAIDNKGFTLIELVVIITLIGILAVAVLPRFNLDSFTDDKEATLFLTHIRYAQHKSMVTGGGWSIWFDLSENEYRLKDHNDTVRQFPGNIGPNPNKVEVGKIKIAPSTRTEIYFNYLGVPVDNKESSLATEFPDVTEITIGEIKIKLQPYTGGIL